MTTDAENRQDDADPASAGQSETGVREADERPDASAAASTVDPAGRKHLRGPAFGSLFALALAFFAAAAAGFLWWQYRQFYVALDRADGASAVALRDLRAELRALDDRMQALVDDREALVGVVEEVVERVNGFPARFADLNERLAAASGVSADARGRWLRARAEYYLSIANSELSLGRNRATAVAALELADRALLDSGDPAFGAVREQIAGELLALRAVAVPDVEGSSFSLGQLAASVPTLPMRAPGPDGADAAVADDAPPPGIGRLWQSIKNALAGMFRIERRDAVTVGSLTRNQQVVVRRQLELELSLARAALVEAMPELFAASIANARALLQTHFDVDRGAVEGAIALLDEMAAVDVAPRYPDISRSLALLRNIADRDG